MSDDLVKQSLLELQDLVRCRCHEAYRGRGLRDPDCECDSSDAVNVVADRIEELEALLWAAEYDAKEAETYTKKLEIKLAKAVEALGKVCRLVEDQCYCRLYSQDAAGWEACADDIKDVARTTLAELKGQDDE